MTIGSAASSFDFSQHQFNRQLNYYVDGALGNDSNVGTMNSPFKTIQAAINAADETNNAGENHIFVNPGRYREALQVSDDDLLTINGLGENSWDVFVDSTFAPQQRPATLGINGGSELGLSNMWFTGEQTGIEATHLGKLVLDEIVSGNNASAGMNLLNIGEVQINNSRFFKNGAEGIAGFDVNSFDAKSSYFLDNDNAGIHLTLANQVYLESLTSMRNGFPNLGGAASVSGIDLYDVDQLAVMDGKFNNNHGSGLFGFNVANIDLRNLVAYGNDFNGAFFTRAETVNSQRNRFLSNGRNGMSAIASNLVPADQTWARFSHDQYLGNGDNGAVASGFYRINGHDLDARWNRFDGLFFTQAEMIELAHSYFYQNGFHGAELFATKSIDVGYVNSQHNAQSGLQLYSANRINVHGGSYMHNRRFGIRVQGISTNRVEAFHGENSTVKNNWDGIKFEFTRKVLLENGYYAHNRAHGIHLINFNYATLNYVNASNNWGSGVQFHVGQYCLNCASENTNDIQLMGGAFDQNHINGITLSTQFDRVGADTNVNFDARHVTATGNDKNGIGMQSGDPKHSVFADFIVLWTRYFEVKIKHSVFSANGAEGIFMFADRMNDSYLQTKAHIEYVQTNHNGLNGFSMNTTIDSPLNNGSNGSGLHSAITVKYSQFNHNHLGGINLGIWGDLRFQSEQNALTIDNIDVHHNHGNGLTLNSIVDWEPDAESQARPKIKIKDSRFHGNHMNGLDLRDGFWDVSRNAGLDQVIDLQLDRVNASGNWRNGLNIGGNPPNNANGDPFRPNVWINGGWFSANHQDGMWMHDIHEALIDQSTIAGNMDDGLQLNNVFWVDYASVYFAANGDKDVETD